MNRRSEHVDLPDDGRLDAEADPSDWPELSAVQQWFQAVVTHPGGIDSGVESDEAAKLVRLTRDELETMVTRSERVSARDRLAIYANAYYARLIECLADCFPVLKRTLGEELFNRFAFDYLQTHPSRSYTLGRLGESFAAYLYDSRPDGADAEDQTAVMGWPDFLIDLAEFEWAIAGVFDGPGLEDSPLACAEQLETLAEEDWPKVRFRMAPCLRLLTARFPLNNYYTEARRVEAGTKPSLPQPAPSFLAISRREYVVRRHDLSEAQYVILTALANGRTLVDAIEAATDVGCLPQGVLEADLNRWFSYWTRNQFFESVVIPGASDES